MWTREGSWKCVIRCPPACLEPLPQEIEGDKPSRSLPVGDIPYGVYQVLAVLLSHPSGSSGWVQRLLVGTVDLLLIFFWNSTSRVKPGSSEGALGCRSLRRWLRGKLVGRMVCNLSYFFGAFLALLRNACCPGPDNQQLCGVA